MAYIYVLFYKLMRRISRNTLKMPQLQSRRRARFIYPPEVWDSLSKIWLTTDALRELNRRNKQNESNLSSQRLRARLTRLSVEDKFKSTKSFARHGGPDLSDLRGVFLLIPSVISL